MRRRTIVIATLVAVAATCGCQKPLRFPAESVPAVGQAAATAYETSGDGKADFFTYADDAGRITRIGYDTNGDGAADEVVALDEIDFSARRHVVVILDGIGYDVVKRYYDSGGLRLFHPPSRVIAPYPTLTDVSLEDVLGYVPCRGFEAMYYDRRLNKVVGGSGSYLSGANQPYNRLLDYRSDLLWDAIGYVAPEKVFGKEVNDLIRVIQREDRREVIGYLVSSAGVGTAYGAEGQIRVLKRIDRLAHQLVQSSRGLVQLTLLADHGHSYTPAKRIGLEKYLKDKGWRLAESLRKPKDLAYIRFGLETYASFACRMPAELAADLAAAEGVTIVSYVDGDAVVVLSSDGGRAKITKRGGRYKYATDAGDPLKLADALSTLSPDSEGYYDDRELFDATAMGEYPDALDRLWRAHFSLAENVPDVIISLADEYYSGSTSFGESVKVASTHGGLNRSNSTTFLMSTAGTLPPLMRSREIPAHMTVLLHRPWPAKTK